ncbi:hypothetical protein [Flavobacterium maritimum]|uniref:hypothetical protein n=1 Tax=Flavobacterium maritimum TaxID=3149042 RepID=UPI0032B389CE
MNISEETLNYIFGGTIITGIAAFIAITTNFLNITDRFKKWKNERKKKKYKKSFYENNPDFKFSLNYISNPQPGKCILRANLLNVSKEVKFIESTQYKFEDPKNPKKYEPTNMVMDGEKWPKRLEHGEHFSTSVDYSMILLNVVFQYWRKGFKVYCTCKSTTGDFLQSNSIEFDKLMDFMDPIDEKYKNLAMLLSKKTGGSQRDIEVSLWQLQIFKRLTVHIAKQLQYNNIPIAEYLITGHGLIPQEDIWYHWYMDIEQKQIQPEVIEEFLESLL